MYFKLLLSLSSLVLVISCNNDGSKKETQEDTVQVSKPQDDHSHTASSQTIPDLPAVPEGARVYFENLKDGEDTKSPLKIKMGVEKIRIDTAGPVVSGSGHHHLLIDRDGLPGGETIPKDSLNIHFGRGQTETEISLAPGKHKLTLQFADGLHRSYGPQLSATITVNVKK